MLQILLQENEYPMMVYQAYEHHTCMLYTLNAYT